MNSLFVDVVGHFRTCVLHLELLAENQGARSIQLLSWNLRALWSAIAPVKRQALITANHNENN